MNTSRSLSLSALAFAALLPSAVPSVAHATALGGGIDVDGADLRRSRGEIGVDLGTFATSTFVDDRDAKQTLHARNWFEIGGGRDARGRPRCARGRPRRGGRRSRCRRARRCRCGCMTTTCARATLGARIIRTLAALRRRVVEVAMVQLSSAARAR